MFLTIIILPLLSFLGIGLFGRFIGYKGAMRISLCNLLISNALMLCFLCCVYKYDTVYYLNLGNWFQIGDLTVDFSFMVDKLTIVMFAIVLPISYLVHLYSCIYMKSDPHLSRFLAYLSLFTFFMLVLVSADNIIFMFVGWEGVGLVSYLLVGFWNTRIEANKASLKALVVNRIGDVCLMLGIAVCLWVFRTCDFHVIYAMCPYMVNKYVTFFGTVKLINLICVLFFIAIVGKSAQLFLHIWLPDSMEGPTPVSALIHAATMVTAGIYFTIRMSYLFEFSSFTRSLMVGTGMLTAVVAGLVAFAQDDIKKIIAYSTCSQLGYMFSMCGMSQYNMALYHLVNHAFFKALLFLASGVLIFIYKNQDLRKMSGLRQFSGFMYGILLVGVLSSDGFFFFSSIESKDFMIEIYSYQFITQNSFFFVFGLISLFLTLNYNANILSVCEGIYVAKNKERIDIRFIIVLTVLATLTILSNFLLSFMFAKDFFLSSVFINIANQVGLEVETLSVWFKIMLISLYGVLHFPPIVEKEDKFGYDKRLPKGFTIDFSHMVVTYRYFFIVFVLFIILMIIDLLTLNSGTLNAVIRYAIVPFELYLIWCVTKTIARRPFFTAKPHIFKRIFSKIFPFSQLEGLLLVSVFMPFSAYLLQNFYEYTYLDVYSLAQRCTSIWICLVLFFLMYFRSQLLLVSATGFSTGLYLGMYSDLDFFNEDVINSILNSGILEIIYINAICGFIYILLQMLRMFNAFGDFDKQKEGFKKIQNYVERLLIYYDCYNIMDYYKLMHSKFGFDSIFNFFIARKLYQFAYFVYSMFDKGILEILGPEGLSASIYKFLKHHKVLFAGNIYNYICIFLLIIILIIIVFYYF